MARNNGRWGRLRRVLNEDLSTSTVIYGATSADRTPGDTPRYGAGANIENHPQVTDYVPRRFRAMGLIIAGGAALGLLAETVAHHAETLSGILGASGAELTEALSDRLVAWTSAMTLIVAAAYARVVYLLKRHRLDDLGGRYRAWRHASWLAILLSANCVVAGHTLFALSAGHLTGIHPLGSDTAWWLVPTILVGAWVLGRLIRDAAECRTALAAFALSAACFTIAVACRALWSPVDSPLWSETLTRSLPLVGWLSALTGTLLTARYVVLDVQGLIEHDLDPVKPSAAMAISSSRSRASSANHSSANAEQEVAWTDGSEGDYDDGNSDDGDNDRPLTKAERKRLRKQQGRFRAA